MRVLGADASCNDLIALGEDLETLASTGFRVAPLADVVEALERGDYAEFASNVACLTCDDGSNFDAQDLVHPAWGPQRSILTTLTAFEASHAGLRAHATSFVIASPRARQILDRTCMVGQGWWSDDWWAPALASGCMHIASHSWDHNHDSLPPGEQHGRTAGTFLTVDDAGLADLEIRQANEFLREHAPNPGNALFAYPYGEASDYLASEYLPRFGNSLGLRAAFTTEPAPLTRYSPRWRMPRYVRGRDWSSRGGLERILREARA